MKVANCFKEVDLSPGASTSKGGAGWAYVLRFRSRSKIIKGRASSKSEYRMLLLAVVNGLKKLRYPCIVNLRSSSHYVLRCGRRLLEPTLAHSHPWVARVRQQTGKHARLRRESE